MAGKGEMRKARPKAARMLKKHGAVQRSVSEIEALEARIHAGAPSEGSNPLANSLPHQIEPDPETGQRPYAGAKLFEQLPISQLTMKGLKDAKYTTMTEIQRAAIPHALCGRDVLGAAKTGSGKTLAFLIPMIEKLYRLRWGAIDGVGALVISPTRELAVQIFEELRKVGKYHSLSGGLLIGGRKDVDNEKQRVNNLNILVCTPGRLLQHMHETVNFDCSQLQLLVLDEADRILDMGFAQTLNQILDQLPKERQTFLFSATQTKSVQDLARLSLQSPEYLAVHAESSVATPARLKQTAMVVPLDQKIDTLWSFIKTHLRAKILVFFSSCKEVKFVHEAFKHMRPGIPISCLHGRLKQTKRLDVFFKFVQAKDAVLFATDIAARGLDFPTVDWVIQGDCPEDVATYIHRVGRTARYTNSGRSLLLLAPSEVKMITLLREAKIPIDVLKANANKIQHISQSIAGLLSKDPGLKYMAQRAFITYLRSVHLQRNKEIFDVQKLPIEEFAASLGLPSVPRVRFLKKDSRKNESYDLKNVTGEEEVPKLERILKGDLPQESDQIMKEEDGEQGFFRKKRAGEDLETAKEIQVAKPKKKKLKIDPRKGTGQRVVFDDDGEALPPLLAMAKEDNSEQAVDEDVAAAAEARYKKLQEEMKKRDKEDRLLERQRLREKRLKKKQKKLQTDEGVEAVRLRVSSDDEDATSRDEDEMDEEETQKMEVDSLSLADQEALALKLLSSKT